MNSSNRTAKAIAIGVMVGMTALAGCASGGTKGENSSGSDSGIVTITFAAAPLATPGRGPKIVALFDEFNASQDKVRVIPAAVPYPTFAKTILTQMAGGKGPDLIRFDIPDFAQAASANLLEPLDGVIDAKELNLIEGPDKYNFVNGKRYGVIFEAINYGVIYNTDLVKTPPTTFDQFIATAKGATKGGVYGFAVRHTLPESDGMWIDLCNFIYGFGGNWSNGHQLTLDSPEVLKGLTAYKEVYDANVIPKGATASTYRTMFAEGKVAMVIDHGGITGVVAGLNPKLHFSAVRIPFPVKSQAVSVAPMVVNAAGTHKAAAETFLKWLLQPANQRKLQTALGASSVATPVERSADELAKAPYDAVFDGLTDSGQSFLVTGFEAKTAEIRKIVIDQVLSALQGQQDMKSAMEESQKLAAAAVGG